MKNCCKPNGSSCIARCMKYIALGVVGITIAGWVVMCLWNWLLPEIADLKSIGFLQGVGLLVLSKILFGNFHGRCCSRCARRHESTVEDAADTPKDTH